MFSIILSYFFYSDYSLAKLFQTEHHPRAVCIQQQADHRAVCALYSVLQFRRQFIRYGTLPIGDKQDIGILERFLAYQSQRFPERRFKTRPAWAWSRNPCPRRAI